MDIITIFIGIVLLFVGMGLVFIVEAQGMSDEEREKYGLGPKGQGRR